jgi:hypothetical protein
LDYSDTPCRVYLGEYVPREELKLQGLRTSGAW